MSEKKVILILGKRGSGKSYLTQSMLKNYSRYVIFDTLGEYTDGVSFENLKEMGEFWDKHFERPFRIIYQPINPEKVIDEANEKTEFDIICDLAFDCGDMALIVEELDTFCSSSGISDSFANIIQRGRHRNITLIGISQRPYGINRLISSQAKEIYSFVMTEPRDIEYLAQYIGKDVEEIFPKLGQYQYLKWSADSPTAISTGKAGGKESCRKEKESKEEDSTSGKEAPPPGPEESSPKETS